MVGRNIKNFHGRIELILPFTIPSEANAEEMLKNNIEKNIPHLSYKIIEIVEVK